MDQAPPHVAPHALPRDRVAEALRSWIQEGKFVAGARLPSEAALTARLGVSRPTVRAGIRVLEEEGLVSAPVRRRRFVMAPTVARDVHPVMNQTIAVLTDRVETTEPRGLRSTGWELFIQEGAIEAIRLRGLSTLLMDPERVTLQQAQRLSSDALRGALLFAHHSPADEARGRVVLALRDTGIAIVGYGVESQDLGLDTVTSDHEAGGYLLTKWLLEQGRRNILRVWVANSETGEFSGWLKHRDAGVMRAAAEAGISLPPALVTPLMHIWPDTRQKFEWSVRNALVFLRDAIHQLPQRPDALMLASDGMTCPIAAACRQLGMEPNKDIAIVGYDNYWADVVDRRWESCVPLATVDRDNKLVGQAMVELLEERVEGRLPQGPQCRMIKPRLVIVNAPS